MATHGPTQLPAFFNTDADFRSWVAGIKTALTDCGLVQTADTGQIDTATVAKPAAINTAQGYTVHRFNDTLQATKPVFIKVEYGSGAGAIDRPGLWATVGTSTNGAGTIGGQAGTRQQTQSGASKLAGNTLPVYASGDGSYISLAVNLDAAANTFRIFIHVDRPRDAAGAGLGDAIYTSYNGALDRHQVIPFSGAVPAAASELPALLNAGGVISEGVDKQVASYQCFSGIGKCRPIFGAVMYDHAAIAGLASIVVDHFGGNKTFMPLGVGHSGSSAGRYLGGTPAVAILWQ